MTKHDKKLLNIANKELFYCLDRARTDLERHYSDEEDFIDLYICDIKKALEAAYQLGREEAMKN